MGLDYSFGESSRIKLHPIGLTYFSSGEVCHSWDPTHLIRPPQMVSLDQVFLFANREGNVTWAQLVQLLRAYARTGQLELRSQLRVRTPFFASLYPANSILASNEEAIYRNLKSLKENMVTSLLEGPFIQPYALPVADALVSYPWSSLRGYLRLLTAGVLQEGALFGTRENSLTGGHIYAIWLQGLDKGFRDQLLQLQQKLVDYVGPQTYGFNQAWGLIPQLDPTLSMWDLLLKEGPYTDVHASLVKMEMNITVPVIDYMYRYGVSSADQRWTWLLPAPHLPTEGPNRIGISVQEVAAVAQTTTDLLYILRAYYRSGQLDLAGQLFVSLLTIDDYSYDSRSIDPLTNLIAIVPIADDFEVETNPELQALTNAVAATFSAEELQLLRAVEFYVINIAVLENVLDIAQDDEERLNAHLGASFKDIDEQISDPQLPSLHQKPWDRPDDSYQVYNRSWELLASQRQTIRNLAINYVLLQRFLPEGKQTGAMMQKHIEGLDDADDLWPQTKTYLRLLQASYKDPLHPVERVLVDNYSREGVPGIFMSSPVKTPYLQALDLPKVLGELVNSYGAPTYDQVLTRLFE